MSNTHAVEAVTAALKRAHEVQQRINAFITINDEHALASAANVAPGAALQGEPIIVKDNIVTKDVRTTAGSRTLETYVPVEDATVITRLTEAGGVVVGKANLDEFGMGSTGEASAFGATTHPFDDTFVPGGSSSGSAAAVAAGVARVALGTDTGGSVRQPAAFCRVYGYKPTYGLIPRTGVIPYTSSLDSVGVIAAGMEDIERIVPILVGRDGHDDLVTVNGWDDLPAPSEGKKTLGVVREYAEYLDDDMQQWFDRHLEMLSETFDIVTVEIPLAVHTSTLYTTIANAEGVSNIARFTGMVFGNTVADEKSGHVAAITENRSELLGSEVKKRLLVGMHAISAEHYANLYERAERLRGALTNQVAEVLGAVDALITPTVNRDPFRLGEDRTVTPIRFTFGDRMLNLANLAHCCAISLPSADEHWRGIQLVGAAQTDRKMLAMAQVVDGVFRPTK